MADVARFLHGQLFQTPPSPTTDLAGRTVVVTGANSGLGLDCARHLLSQNVSHLVLACRSIAKGEAAKQDLVKHLSALPYTTKTGEARNPQITAWAVDLSHYRSVCNFANRCTAELERLDGVVCNAGVDLRERSTAEDNETTITINVVSTFLLATLLVPKLRESARRFNIAPRISIVGSAVHNFAQTKAISTAAGKGESLLAAANDERSSPMAGQYNLSKLLVMLGVREFAAQLTHETEAGKEPFVLVNCVNPGWCKTELFRQEREYWGRGEFIALRVMGRSSEEGSRTLAHGVSAGKETHGQYVSECQVKRASAFVRSADGARAQKALWGELSEKFRSIQNDLQ